MKNIDNYIYECDLDMMNNVSGGAILTSEELHTEEYQKYLLHQVWVIKKNHINQDPNRNGFLILLGGSQEAVDIAFELWPLVDITRPSEDQIHLVRPFMR